jgi:AraC family transcriptional regulator
MHQPQCISTTRSAPILHEKDLAAFAPVARERRNGCGDGLGGLGGEGRTGQDTRACEDGEHRTGLLPWQVKRVRDYVDADLHDRVSLSTAAAHARLSPNYFSRCFRQSFGVTFSRFVAGRRVERAQGLMIASAGKLCHIALACGFADQAHFTRTFGHLLGCTPARWRRQVVMSRSPVKLADGALHGRQAFLGNLEFHPARSWRLPERARPLSSVGSLQEYRP